MEGLFFCAMFRMDDETQLDNNLIYLFLIHVSYADLLRVSAVHRNASIKKYWLQFLSVENSDEIPIYTEFCTTTNFIGERGGFISKTTCVF